MSFAKIKSNAKINLALNVVGKSKKLHKIESLVAFIEHHDLILIKKIRSKNNRILFNGKFSKNINSKNTVSRLFDFLERKELINQKYLIKITKNIPQKAGLGGGSMNAANILKYFIKKKIIKLNTKQISENKSLISGSLKPQNAKPATNAKIIKSNSSAMNQLEKNVKNNRKKMTELISKSQKNSDELMQNKNLIKQRRNSAMSNRDKILANKALIKF